MKAKVILTAVAVFASLSFAAAKETKSTTTESKKSCYVDANNNNLCDKYEDKSCTTGNGKGLQDGSGNRNGKGKGLHNGNGRRNGNGYGHHNRNGNNYVDANKNNVCDHNEVKK